MMYKSISDNVDITIEDVTSTNGAPSKFTSYSHTPWSEQGRRRKRCKKEMILAMGGIEPPSGRRCWNFTSTTTHATTTPHHLSLCYTVDDFQLLTKRGQGGILDNLIRYR
ncbi:hypothetical protein KCU83_g165, partial [Aureobasidium melanogenum]